MTPDPVIEQQVINRMAEMYAGYAEALNELNKLKTGEVVLFPVDMEHARMMVRIGQHYINETHRVTFDALTKEY